jgi:hypothetical protein
MVAARLLVDELLGLVWVYCGQVLSKQGMLICQTIGQKQEDNLQELHGVDFG